MNETQNDKRSHLGIASVVLTCIGLLWPSFMLWSYFGARIIFPSVVADYGWLFPYSFTFAVLGLALGGVGTVRQWKSLTNLGLILGLLAWVLHWFVWQHMYPG